jgi:hypothetical protein
MLDYSQRVEEGFREETRSRRAKSAKEYSKASANTSEGNSLAWTVKGATQPYSVSPVDQNRYIVRPFKMDSACTTTIVHRREVMSHFNSISVVSSLV